MRSTRFRTSTGDGYDIDTDMRDGTVLNFRQIKGGEVDGLFVSFYFDHCESWMRFTNGMAVGKWFVWGAGNTLLIEAEFKAPYDCLKHSHHVAW
jgi:hypothetical protein